MNLEDRAHMAEKKKCCVRWSTPESRAAGQVSLLAIVETVFAVALYWWIAFYFDTHLHLVTSRFVAPLLLLRSERSIEAGIDWFLRGPFDAESYKEWSRPRKNIWLGVMAVLGFVANWWISSYLAHFSFEGQTGPLLFGTAAAIGLIGAIVGFMVATYAWIMIAYVAAIVPGISPAVIADVDAASTKVAGTVAGACVAVAVAVATSTVVAAGAAAGAGAIVGVGMVVVAMRIGIGMKYAIKYAIKAIMIRLLATLRFLFFDGIRSLPGNWRENNFVIDAMTPAEPVPGIGKHDEAFTLKGYD